MAKGYSLKKTVRAGKPADGDDVFVLKQALRDEGFYVEPVSGINSDPDDNLFDAIKGFQNANGLAEDGVMKPGGETERRMSPLIQAIATMRCIICGAWHGGVFSPKICSECWKKGFS